MTTFRKGKLTTKNGAEKTFSWARLGEKDEGEGHGCGQVRRRNGGTGQAERGDGVVKQSKKEGELIPQEGEGGRWADNSTKDGSLRERKDSVKRGGEKDSLTRGRMERLVPRVRTNLQFSPVGSKSETLSKKKKKERPMQLKGYTGLNRGSQKDKKCKLWKAKCLVKKKTWRLRGTEGVYLPYRPN